MLALRPNPIIRNCSGTNPGRMRGNQCRMFPLARMNRRRDGCSSGGRNRVSASLNARCNEQATSFRYRYTTGKEEAVTRIPRVLLAIVLFIGAGCGKEQVYQPPPSPPPAPSVAIDMTFDIASSDTVRGTAANCPRTSVIVPWQCVENAKGGAQRWEWASLANGDSVLTLDASLRWRGSIVYHRVIVDTLAVLLMRPESLAVLPKTVPIDGMANVERHALAVARVGRPPRRP